MKVLAIECSENPASCAVTENGKIICESFVSVGLTHSRTLMPMVEDMLKNAQISIGDIDCFAASVGPGSFTGLRIGVAAVKGMAMGVNKTCVGVSTLHAAAYGAAMYKGIICPVMDARCNQVYNALFYSDGKSLTRICEDRALMVDELIDSLKYIKAQEKYKNEKIILTSNGAKIYASQISQSLEVEFAPEHIISQRASFVAGLAEGEKAVSAAELLPVYLRLPQAERELKAKNNL